MHPFIELMRQLESRQQVLVLVWAGFATLAMMLNRSSLRRES